MDGMEAKARSDELSREAEEAQEEGAGSDDLNPIDRQYAVQSDVPRRIHILGMGSIGKLVAHSLRGVADPPPVTLMLHKYRQLYAWEEGKQEITIQDDGHAVSRGGFDVELLPPGRREHGVEVLGAPSVHDVAKATNTAPHEAAQLLSQQPTPFPPAEEEQKYHPKFRRSSRDRSPRRQELDYARSQLPIHNLIVATKASTTIPALLSLKNRIGRDSTICFLQNGMGIIDDVNASIFPSEEDRPNYVQGIITHGVNVPPEMAEQDPFFAVHAGHGTIALGLLPRKPVSVSDPSGAQKEIWAPTARYLLRTLTRVPTLCAVGFTPTELLQQQLEKLAVNSILNPLTSLLDARNGSLLHNFALTRTLRLMLAETSLVIRSLPELQHIPNVKIRFSPERLESLVVSVAEKTRDNISSMLADVRAGKRTEVEWINGYIVRRGEELGIKCVVNYGMMMAVVGKSDVIKKELGQALPVAGRRRHE